jgi:4-hydroxy-3-methylbut-2-enyl diphosphate reductase
MQVKLANPRGFCAGVDRAIDIVNRAIDLLGAPIYVRHEVVHNKVVVDGLRHRGAIFVEELEEVPAGSTVIFLRTESLRPFEQKRRSEASRSSTRLVPWSRKYI